MVPQRTTTDMATRPTGRWRRMLGVGLVVTLTLAVMVLGVAALATSGLDIFKVQSAVSRMRMFGVVLQVVIVALIVTVLILAARRLQVGDRSLRLRGFKLGGAGRDTSGVAIGVALGIGPFAHFIHGKEIEIPALTTGTAKLAEPLHAAPTSDASGATADPAAPAQARHPRRPRRLRRRLRTRRLPLLPNIVPCRHQRSGGEVRRGGYRNDT